VNRAAIATAFLLWLTACATPTSLQPLASDDPRPRRFLDDWIASAGQRRGLRGIARLAVDRDDGSIYLRGKQIVLVERPSSLRVEILGILNQPLAVIVTDGESYEVFHAQNQSYESGSVDASLLWNEAGIDLRPEEAVALLLGVPISSDSIVPAGAVQDGAGKIRIDLTDAEGVVRQRGTFDSSGRLHSFEVLDPRGEIAWVAQFRDYREIDGLPFAHAISLDVSAGKTHAEISFGKVELNPQLPADIFRLQSPRGGAPAVGGAER